ncbi:bifunctional alpha/beta hydrolase/OsmC family protein [Kribbella sp. NPDC026596]|uniref:bifunctional alpha/beta hydrolase/OsmC family protein n=1 Tax=Kribbella sp. NPDC026596 TaxID=3155122 RepID=UPI0033C7102D
MTQRQRVQFVGSTSDTLVGRLDLPEGRSRATALFAHCFTCGKDSHAAARIARALVAQGIAVLRFDFTGLGESDGEFAGTTFSSNVGDLVKAADFLREHHEGPSLLIGHSLGGAAVLAAAGAIPEVRAVVTVAAPADPAHVTGLFGDEKAEVEARGEAEVTLAGRTFRVRREFLDDIAEQPQLARITDLGQALLVVHSPTDNVVGIDNARRIYEAARHPKSFMALEGADHLLTRTPDAEYVADVIAAWVRRYLPDPRPDALSRPGGDPGVVVVSESGDGRYAQQVVAGRHVFVADEPDAVGGNDSGPSPYGLLLAALGACTAMTARMYAERKGLPLDSTSVTLRHSRIHARDCETCATGAGLLDHVDRVVSFAGDLTDDQRARLLEIVDRCPVHRTLTSEVVIETRADPL